VDDKRLNLFASIIGMALKDIKEFKPLVKRAMVASFEPDYSWMITDDDTRFKSAVAAIYVKASEEDRERIMHEMKTLQSLNAVMSGVPVNMERLADEASRFESIGLLSFFKEAKAAVGS